MGFRNKIPEAAKAAGIVNAFQLAKAAGLSPMAASRLWKDFSRCDVDSLHRLCELFDCQISDFLEYDRKPIFKVKPVKKKKR